MNGRSKLASADCAPGDEQDGGFSRAQLLRMHERFVRRMERAIERGLERPPNGDASERAA